MALAINNDKINMFFRKKSYPLSFLITGFEHSGTTLISEIMRQHPDLDSGFEGGMLLCNKVSKFYDLEPFSGNFKRAWKIEDQDFQDICDSKNFGEAYLKVRKYSKAISNKKCKIFDKTPRYLQKLTSVLEKVPDVNAVVIVRDMRSIMDSTFRRSKMEIDDWMDNTYPITLKHTRSYLDGLTRALDNKKLNKRILVIRYEELILNQSEVTKKMFSHLKYDFKDEYLYFNEVKYKHVYGNDIQDQFIHKYREKLSKDIQSKIKNDFSDYSEYFWED